MAKISNYSMACGCVGTCSCGAQGIIVVPGQGGARGAQGIQGPQGTTGSQGTGVSLQTVENLIAGAALDTTDDLPEGVTNKYFTVGRVAYIHTQGVASDTWTINHNLGFNPAVSIVDSGENVVIGDVTYISTNTLSVSFNASFGGKAYLS